LPNITCLIVIGYLDTLLTGVVSECTVTHIEIQMPLLSSSLL